jgi:hypothetical protein
VPDDLAGLAEELREELVKSGLTQDEIIEAVRKLEVAMSAPNEIVDIVRQLERAPGATNLPRMTVLPRSGLWQRIWQRFRRKNHRSRR